MCAVRAARPEEGAGRGIRTEGEGAMDDLQGSAHERLARLQSGERGDEEWLHRQLVAALEGWRDAEDQVREFREGHQDY